MQPEKLKQFRERLLDQRRDLVLKRERVLEAIPEEVNPPGESEIVPSEGIDIEISLDETDAARLREIDAALLLIKRGTFGQCSECGCEISEARLDAIPSALCCVRCAEALDRG